MYVFEIDPSDVLIGKGVNDYIVFQCFYIQYIAMRNAIIAPIGTDANVLGIDSFEIGFVIGEQLVITFGFGNSLFETLRSDGLY